MLKMKVEGLQGLQQQLAQIGADLGQKALISGAREAMKPVLEAAKAGVRVDTGLTRDSLVLRAAKPKAGETVAAVGLVVKVGKGGGRRDIAKAGAAGGKRGRKAAHRKSAHWRWHFIEFGTRHKSARPFLRPALHGNRVKAVNQLGRLIRKAIDRAIKRKAKAAAKGRR